MIVVVRRLGWRWDDKVRDPEGEAVDTARRGRDTWRQRRVEMEAGDERISLTWLSRRAPLDAARGAHHAAPQA